MNYCLPSKLFGKEEIVIEENPHDNYKKFYYQKYKLWILSFLEKRVTVIIIIM